MKRKLKKNKNQVENDSSSEKKTKDAVELLNWNINYNTPETVLSSLLFPHKLEDFISTYWEKQPLVIKRANNQSVSLPFSRLFSKEILFQILKKYQLTFIDDINVCRYVNGTRKNMNWKGRITAKKAADLLEKSRATLQIHQPQRFIDELWKLMEKLECYFKCLVGANVYMTPSDSQGLPPHYDDVEVFILQLEGSKEWKLYKPPVLLPRQYSHDLSQEEIGEPTHDFTLCAGDLLYMPRGTVHQAKTPKASNSHSTHITISTYQKHTFGDYLMSIFPALLEKAMDTSVCFRQGLPLGFLSHFQMTNNVVENLLQELPKVASKYKPFTPLLLIEDFMKSRLPPFGIDREAISNSTPSGASPHLKSFIVLSFPHHISCTLSDEEDNDGRSSYLLVYSSLMNDRSTHMIKQDDEDEEEDQNNNTLKFPCHYIKAMEQLQSHSGQPLCVAELDLQSDTEKTNLALSLWSQHLITVTDKKS